MTLRLDRNTWQRVAFGDVVKNVNETVRDPEGQGIHRFIAMEHLDPGALKVRRWGDLEEGTTFTRRVRPGQTLFGKRRAYQRKAAHADFDAICSGDILVFEPESRRMSSDFLPFLVQSEGFYAHALRTSAGSLSPRTNWSDLSDYQFHLPPLDQQKRMANLFWALERHRHQIQRAGHVLAEARIAMVKRALAGAETHVPLSDAALIASGITLGPKRDALTRRAPYLRVANVQRGALDLNEIKTVGATEAEILNKALSPGDVLVVEGHASTSEIGRAAIWTSEEPALFQNHLFRVRAGVRYRPRFLLEAINGPGGRAYMRMVAKSTSGLNTINSTVLRAMPIPDLPAQDQDALLSNLERADSVRRRLASEDEAVAALLRAVQADVFESAA